MYLRIVTLFTMEILIFYKALKDFNIIYTTIQKFGVGNIFRKTPFAQQGCNYLIKKHY